MSHHCKSIIVHCMDFRLGKLMKEFLEKEELLDDCDIVSIPGAVKELNFIMDQLDVSVSLHSISEVILSNHTDCGAYGGMIRFSSFDGERAFHVEEMEKAEAAILAKYPHLKVRKILGKLIPGEKPELEEVS